MTMHVGFVVIVSVLSPSNAFVKKKREREREEENNQVNKFEIIEKKKKE